MAELISDFHPTMVYSGRKIFLCLQGAFFDEGVQVFFARQIVVVGKVAMGIDDPWLKLADAEAGRYNGAESLSKRDARGFGTCVNRIRLS